MQSGSSSYRSKKEAKEAKRKTLANLLNSATKRNAAMYKNGSEYQDEMNDFQSQALQQMARGFAESLHRSYR